MARTVTVFIIPLVNHSGSQSAELLREIKQGLNVEENFRQLFERHGAQVQRFFQRKGLGPEDSRDLTQETFVSVYRGLKALRQEEQFESWLLAIARNLWRDHLDMLKARKRAAPLVSFDQSAREGEEALPPLVAQLADPRATPLETALEREKLAKLREALQQLPEQMRRCAQLRVVNDLSYAEIAALMGLSVNTIKAHLHQAQKTLKERLSAYFDEIEI